MDYTYAGGVGRAKRTTPGGDYTWYNGNSEEAAGTNGDGDGALTRSYYGNADVLGSDPATGNYRYYMKDHLGSTRSVFDENKNLIASYDYTPYGAFTRKQGPEDITALYTGHDWDPDARLYYAPFRFLSPDTARWMNRDPYGMVDGPNMFAYVIGNPIRYVDPTGLFTDDVVGDMLDGQDRGGGSVRAGSWVPRAPLMDDRGKDAVGGAASFLDGLGANFGIPGFGCWNPAPSSGAYGVGQAIGMAPVGWGTSGKGLGIGREMGNFFKSKGTMISPRIKPLHLKAYRQTAVDVIGKYINTGNSKGIKVQSERIIIINRTLDILDMLK